jgi:hypothetical protein
VPVINGRGNLPDLPEKSFYIICRQTSSGIIFGRIDDGHPPLFEVPPKEAAENADNG